MMKMAETYVTCWGVRVGEKIGKRRTHKLDGPWDGVARSILDLPELGGEHLAHGVTDEEYGVDCHFLRPITVSSSVVEMYRE